MTARFERVPPSLSAPPRPWPEEFCPVHSCGAEQCWLMGRSKCVRSWYAVLGGARLPRTSQK